MFTSDSERFGDTLVLPPFPNCGHCPVVTSFILQFPTLDINPNNTFRLWHRGKYTVINDFLDSIDWDLEFAYQNLNQMYSRFDSILSSAINHFIPIKSSNSSTNLPFPMKPPPQLKRLRSTLWSHYKFMRQSHGRNSDIATKALNDFLVTNYQYRNFSISSQINYESSLVDQLTSNPKVFHSYIRRKKVGRPTIGPLKSLGQVIQDPQSMSELFASSFASVYIASPPDSPAPHQLTNHVAPTFNIQLTDVTAALAVLDGSSSMGPDNIHPFFLKSCCKSLAYPLLLIFRSSLASGTLPQVWKESLVVPIYKKGSRHDPLNYRPISLTSVCVKSLERIITKFVYEYANSHLLFNNDQYGFRPGRSPEDQLILAYNDITLWIDQGYIVDVILFDFCKAFDVVQHDILITKLHCLGIRGNLLDWIRDFLSGRTMRVIVNHQTSSSRHVLSGVPQGSVLGPLLFLFYVNFLNSNIVSPTKLFADDLKLYTKLKSDDHTGLVNCLNVCQNDINTLSAVSKSWGLSMNTSKCVVLRFHRTPINWEELGHSGEYSLNNQPIPIKESAPDLGILIHSSLKFHQHISNIVHKAGGLSHSILKSTLNRDTSFMLPLYIAHIRPLLEYSSSLWNQGYLGDLRLLESVQRRWTKSISGLENLTYPDRLKSLNLFSVKGRLLRHDLILYWKIFHGHSPLSPPDIFTLHNQNIATRGHRYKIAHTRCSLDIRKRFFSVRCVPQWNSLPDSVVSSASLETFKCALAAHYSITGTLFDYA